MNLIRNHWKRIPGIVRKPLIFVMGVTVVMTGIIMLVTPGPGWAAIFLGFAILASEFAFAIHVRDWMIIRFRNCINWYIDRTKNCFKRPKKPPEA